MALVSREDGQLVVYDVISEGPRRVTFAEFVRDRRLWSLGARRLRSEYRGYVPQAVTYCREVCERRQPFDDDFRLDNDRLYCTELVEMAFRESGLPLSEPVPIDQLPGFDRVPPAVRRVVLAAKSIEPGQAVFVPGNDAIGLWSSPCFQPLLDATDIDKPPTDERP